MNSIIPICFFPLKKIILDDDEIFLQSLLLKMHDKNCIFYSSPESAINYFEQYIPAFTKENLLSDNGFYADSSTEYQVNIDIEQFNKINKKSFYNDISVVLVDYHMPNVKGIDFLMKINELPFKKALITAEEDAQIAIDAFNIGLVDCYLNKNDPNFENKICRIISDLEWKYYTDLSGFIKDLPQFTYLKNTYFVSFFKDYVISENIVEFYLTHIDGDFMIVNSSGEKKYFVLRNKTQLKNLSKLAEEDGGSSDIIEKLKVGKIILFFNRNKYWETPASEWTKYAYTTTEVFGDSNLVWAVVNATF